MLNKVLISKMKKFVALLLSFKIKLFFVIGKCQNKLIKFISEEIALIKRENLQQL